MEQGWNGIAASPKFGGQGLPFSLAVCALESLGSANLGFSLLPLLTVGAIDAIEAHGSVKRARLLARKRDPDAEVILQ